jgi:hypothetical protein
MVEKEDDVGCWDGFFSCFWAVTLSKTENGDRQTAKGRSRDIISATAAYS